ncbi:MAG: SMC family ATPase, partial [Actinomycetota bacterium]|nr:SMC family ATPase [Actinomycetota bacterium]
MLVTRLHLRNYRVYEDALDLEVPPGLVGIVGPNGAGKSYLVESLLFALWGRTRTSIADVRTTGVGGDCVAEVEFEHEGHLYLVRRSVTGANSAVKACAFADGQQMAEGVRDTGRYVHSILGMDDAAFRSSVFAEQKQLAAFSQQRPQQRRELVLKLLGVMPLDVARDDARRDARMARDRLEQLSAVLPDLDALRHAADDAMAAA